MNELQMTKEQEALLDEALKYAQLFEQQAKELSDWGDAFAEKWEKPLRDAEDAEASEVNSYE
jgi:hypothetical protein